MVTGGMLPRAGNSNTVCARSGHSHGFLPSTLTHSTLIGRGLVELQRQVRRTEIVHQPIAQRSAGGEILEGAPLARHQWIEPRVGRRAQPEIPIERAGTGWDSGPVAGMLGWPP